MIAMKHRTTHILDQDGQFKPSESLSRRGRWLSHHLTHSLWWETLALYSTTAVVEKSPEVCLLCTSIQIFASSTASSAMVKTTTPVVILGALYLEWSGDHWGSLCFNHSTSKSSQYLFYNTPTDYLVSDIQTHHWLGSSLVKRRLGTSGRVLVVGLSHSKRCTITRPPFLVKLRHHVARSKPMKVRDVIIRV